MTKVWHSYFYSKLILNSGIPELSTKDSIISYNMRHEWHFLIYEWMYDFHFDIIGINIWLYRSRNTEYIYIPAGTLPLTASAPWLPRGGCFQDLWHNFWPLTYLFDLFHLHFYCIHPQVLGGVWRQLCKAWGYLFPEALETEEKKPIEI